MANKKYGITLNGTEYIAAITDNGMDSYIVNINDTDYPVTVRNIGLQNIADHILGLSENSFIYTGSEINPSIVTDGSVTEGIDYSVSYSNNVSAINLVKSLFSSKIRLASL